MRTACVIVAAALATGLAACASVPVTTAVSLSRLDLLTTDPADLRAAVRLPDAVKIKAGTAKLVVTMTRAGETEPVSRTFPLTPTTLPVETARLARYQKPGFHIDAFRLAPKDAAALTAYRQALVSGTPAGGNRLTLSVSADACRVSGPRDGPVPFTAFIATAADSDYLTLNRETDLDVLVRRHGAEDSLRACG